MLAAKVRCSRCGKPRDKGEQCQQCGPPPRVDDRPTSHQRGYDHRWRRARVQYLAQHPLCRGCLSRGRTQAATVVDHITPHRGDHALFWDPANWQPLCEGCHNRKTGSGQ